MLKPSFPQQAHFLNMWQHCSQMVQHCMATDGAANGRCLCPWRNSVWLPRGDGERCLKWIRGSPAACATPRDWLECTAATRARKRASTTSPQGPLCQSCAHPWLPPPLKCVSEVQIEKDSTVLHPSFQGVVRSLLCSVQLDGSVCGTFSCCRSYLNAP